MSLAPDPLLRERTPACDNNALGVRGGTVPQAVQTPRLEEWRFAVDVTILASFAGSMAFGGPARQGFKQQARIIITRRTAEFPFPFGSRWLAHSHISDR